MKIANKISLSFFLTAVVLAIIAEAVVFVVVRNDIKQVIIRHLNTAVQSRARHIEAFLEENKTKVELMADSFLLESALKPVDANSSDLPEAIKSVESELARFLKTEQDAYGILLLNLDGKVILSTDKAMIGLDKSTDAYYLGAQKQAYIKDAYFSETTKQKGFNISVPIRDDLTQRVIGILVAKFAMTGLDKIAVDRTGLGKTGEIYLINKYAYPITPLRFVKDSFLKFKINTLNAKYSPKPEDSNTHAHTEAEVFTFLGYRGQKVLGSHDHIEETGWGVLGEIDVAEAFQPLVRIGIVFIIVLIFVPIAAWLLGVILGRAIAKPINRLRKGTEMIGGGNLDLKVGIDSQDEVGELSRAFDQMARDLKKTTTSVIKLDQEISDRKKAQASLQESQLRYKTIVESSKDAVMTLRPKGRFLSGNRATVELFGCKNEEEFREQTPATLSPEYQPDGEPSKAKAKKMIDRAMEKGSSFFEWTHKRIRGAEFSATVLLTRMRIKGEDFLQATVRDITEQKKAEGETKKLYEAVKQSPSIIAITDINGNLDYVNHKFSEITGYDLAEVKGKNPRILKSGDQSVEFYKKLWDTIASDNAWHGEFHNKRKNGTLYWESAAISSLKDVRGKITSYIKVAEDVTEAKEYHEKIKEAARIKSEFTSMVSHELRTPLTVIKEGISIVQDGTAGELNPEQKNFLDTAKRNVDRLARLINDVLDFQKLESGGMKFNMTTNDINQIITQVYEDTEQVAISKGLKLKLKLTEIPQLEFDRDKIVQVLTNLISNAFKFTEKGSIVISTKLNKKTGSAVVSIKDSGQGIRKENMGRLFQRFERLASSNERKTGGTGLGLAISKEIINQHAGEIRAESVSGEGSTFSFSLPLKRRDIKKL